MSPTAETRRGFLKKGALGGVLLFVGGAASVGLRKTVAGVSPKGPLLVLTAAEYTIFAAIAEQIVAAPAGAPSTAVIDVAGRADRAMSLALPSVQKEFRQLLHLFDNGLSGALTGTGLAPFTASSPAARDARLKAWATSRLPVFRTGYQAMKRLAGACYYSAPETWKAIGYSGPPEILG